MDSRGPRTKIEVLPIRLQDQENTLGGTKLNAARIVLRNACNLGTRMERRNRALGWMMA